MVNFENLIRTSALTVNWLVYQHLFWSTVAFFVISFNWDYNQSCSSGVGGNKKSGCKWP